jgi:hypothetical protein
MAEAPLTPVSVGGFTWRPNPNVVRYGLKGLGVIGCLGSAAYSVWRELINEEDRGTSEDGSFRWRLLYGYVVLFCFALIVAEIEKVPKKYMKHVTFLNSYAGRSIMYIFVGTLQFKYWVGFITGSYMIAVGILNLLLRKLAKRKVPLLQHDYHADQQAMLKQQDVQHHHQDTGFAPVSETRPMMAPQSDEPNPFSYSYK